MKTIFVAVLLTYATFFLGDYIAARRHFTKETCQHWMAAMPLWAHFIMPGPGNACIDLGYWP